MYLLLGDLQDPWCSRVGAALAAESREARIVANPFARPSRLVWRLDDERSAGWLAVDGASEIPLERIAGVLVRGAGWIDPDGWRAEDLAYVHTETQAALLAWLWSLPCPVLNRYPPSLWYRRRLPLLAWQPLLRRCGLPPQETLVTNVESEARAFRHRLAREGVTGAVYGPLTGDTRYLVGGEDEWRGLAAMQRHAPVALTRPHGRPRLVCVVGRRVVWDREPSRAARALEPALRRFAAASGLDFVELAFADNARGMAVIAVETFPVFEHFADATRARIVAGLVALLTVPAAGGRARGVRRPQRVLA